MASATKMKKTEQTSLQKVRAASTVVEKILVAETLEDLKLKQDSSSAYWSRRSGGPLRTRTGVKGSVLGTIRDSLVWTEANILTQDSDAEVLRKLKAVANLPKHRSKIEAAKKRKEAQKKAEGQVIVETVTKIFVHGLVKSGYGGFSKRKIEIKFSPDRKAVKFPIDCQIYWVRIQELKDAYEATTLDLEEIKKALPDVGAGVRITFAIDFSYLNRSTYDPANGWKRGGRIRKEGDYVVLQPAENDTHSNYVLKLKEELFEAFAEAAVTEYMITKVKKESFVKEKVKA